MVFLRMSFFVTLAKSPGTVGSQRILKPSQKKVSRHIAPIYLFIYLFFFFWGGGVSLKGSLE